MSLKYTVILLPEQEGGYSVTCPALPGCVSQGETRGEALANIKEAADGWLVAWHEGKHPTPVETSDIVAEEVRQCLKDREADELPFRLETDEIELHLPARV